MPTSQQHKKNETQSIMKKKLSIKALFTNLLLAFILFVALVPIFQMAPAAIVGGTVFALGCIPKGSIHNFTLTAGLQKEIWLDQFRHNFYPENSFFTDGIDWSQYVENDKLNFAAAGGDPTVVKNRTRAQYPIPVEYLDDTPLEVELEEYSSNTTVVHDAEAVELAYDKMETVLVKHRNSIKTAYANSGAYNIAPDTETTHTVILEATGTDALTGEACLIDDDFSKLRGIWNDLDYPVEGRCVMLEAHEVEKLTRNSAIIKAQMGYKGAIGTIDAIVGVVHGFTIKTRKTNVLYMDNVGTFEKQAYGKVETANDLHAAIAYIRKHSFVYADGSAKMYDEKSVEYQGHLVNFRKRGLILPFEQKTLAALVIPKA